MGSCSSKKQKRIILDKSFQKTTSTSVTPIKPKNLALNLQKIQNDDLEVNEKKEPKDEYKPSPPPKLYFDANQLNVQKESIFGRPKVQSIRLNSQNQNNQKEDIFFGRKVRYSNSHLQK
ncbi:unnamed protein product (macronuclear) [Paramecium tetraurelia]|uniref:Uncharacterized protein n=1 Tax=Paramecium tetraurelia TaxID=5888 RepID=A0E7E4_PARTE|nr:uncharacterized protein GSPATT00023939001 [Paramecium tetraurelia]CAK91211.1 unnamed protein product [Paramecium tetraurelia]|eukprot:XP_001458608.1 hypothetical protein (macronuclear) [Paramecium tetraurelia strain d4-2]